LATTQGARQRGCRERGDDGAGLRRRCRGCLRRPPTRGRAADALRAASTVSSPRPPCRPERPSIGGRSSIGRRTSARPTLAGADQGFSLHVGARTRDRRRDGIGRRAHRSLCRPPERPAALKETDTCSSHSP
jgi:hypothetical protein